MSESRFLHKPEPILYAPIIEAAVREDLNHGDITTAATVPPGQKARAVIVAKEPCIVAGLFVARDIFRLMDSRVEFSGIVPEGARCEAGDVLFECMGECAAILIAERPALNFLQRMCGTATLTAKFVQAVSKTACRIVDTRKTTPGLRILEKYAVRAGGGFNHRFDLSDGILIKDNHIAACGSVDAAVKRARRNAPHTLKVEVEVTGIPELQEAIDAGADAVLLDNMDCAGLREAVEFARARRPAMFLEASGGVTLENVRDIAETGVDIISSGALTHSAPASDLSLRIMV
jgi:nicotinate-nucleotide pyrophosphorylase (carboxylating)